VTHVIQYEEMQMKALIGPLFGAIVGTVVLGVIVPLLCHLPEMRQALETRDSAQTIAQLFWSLIVAFASHNGAISGAIIGACAGAYAGSAKKSTAKGNSDRPAKV
jgi:hypothetical protein